MAQLTPIPGGDLGTASEEFLESLGRLSKKTGVLATAVLDRKSGTILNTTGSLTSSRISTSSTKSVPLKTTSPTDDPSTGSMESEGFDQLALLVWNFVNFSSELIQGLDTEDEAKLLRLRTKKYELVIVPDAKYLLIAVHETASV